MDYDNKLNDALKKAMTLCARRELCRRDIETKLEKWGIDASGSSKIIGLLIRDKFIDEKRYSSSFARDKFRQNKWGRIKIAVMLRMKRIDEETIKDALSAIDEEEYRATFRKLMENRRKTLKAKSDFELRSKLMKFAASKGFEAKLIYEMLGENE
ncbi:MAG TPA: regulatory protein RecX [Bacteroidales bacterium]|nr:regulatory protein RecX [Bacteroidales bacterium]